MLNSPTLSSSRPQTSGEGNPAPLDSNASDKPSTDARVDASLAEPFAPFAKKEAIFDPFEEELQRDAEFQKQLHEQLLSLILEFHAWSTSRPDSESTSAGEALHAEIHAIQGLEEEQEQSRQRLVEFIARIKAALDALTRFKIGL